jgi:cold shock CspA family protein
MNRRLIISASKSVATSVRSRHTGASSTALRFLTARHFSDTASAEDDDVDIKVGTIKFFRPQGFGIILPDGVHKRNHEQKDLYFIHSNDIKSAEYESGKRIYLTGVERGTRVRFRAGPPDEGKESGKGERRLVVVVLGAAAFHVFIFPQYLTKECNMVSVLLESKMVTHDNKHMT